MNGQIMATAEKTFAKVLIIDDDPVLRALVEQYFSQHGCSDVLHASDGLEALEHVKLHGSAIDLIISDLNMPKLDGVELMGRLKAVGFTGPIIIVSGTYDVVITMAEELASLQDLNIAGTIYKPFTAEKLDEIINAM